VIYFTIIQFLNAEIVFVCGGFRKKSLFQKKQALFYISAFRSILRCQNAIHTSNRECYGEAIGGHRIIQTSQICVIDID